MTSRSSGFPAAVALARRLVERGMRGAAHAASAEYRRQPVHTVYGGAHLFRAETARKLGDLALRSLDQYAPDADAFARALELRSPPEVIRAAYARTVEKLRREPVEDFRLDFEDGYGHRPDAEEDEHARTSARELGRAVRDSAAPPFVGIRVKALTPELFTRSVRTLELFVGELVEAVGAAIPSRFVVTLPKVSAPEQVRALAAILSALERRHRLPRRALRMELMIELPRALVDEEGRIAVAALVDAANARCTSVHLGAYDYTSALDVTAAHQSMLHPACDFARLAMSNALAGTDVAVSDGATNVLPIAPHQGDALSADQEAENRSAIHSAWRLSWRHVTHALSLGIYRGWDLHPAQLPIRYAATYAFFLEGLGAASDRLRTFVASAAQATLSGSTFDDAATGQGLLNFFLRGVACGAISKDEVSATGLSREELESRSFRHIVEARRAREA